MAESTTLALPLTNGTPDAVRASRIPLVAYARDRDTLAKLTEALAGALGPDAVFRMGGVNEMREGLRHQERPMAALIVDVAGEANPIGVLEELAMYVEPGTRVFVIGDNETVEFYRHITRGLGVLEYLCKPLNREVVARIFLPGMLNRSPAQSHSRGGRVVTVTGVRGGVGATTVAVNLSTQLADRSRNHTLLFDADLHGGTAALMLQGVTGGGLRTALENPARVDPLFAERASPAVTERLNLIAAEENLDALINPPEGAARHLVTVMCERYNFIVVDLPRFASLLNHEIRDLAHMRVLVMDATLASLRDMLRFLALPRGPNQASRPIVVLNRIGAPGSLKPSLIAKTLEENVDVTIGWLPKQLPIAATLGKPAVRSRGAFQTAMEKLADEVTPRQEVVRSIGLAGSAPRWWRR